MLTAGNLSERFRLDSEAFSITTSAGATSKRVSMEDYDKCCFIVAMGTAAANSNFTIVVNQSSDSTGAGTTASGALTMGSTSATRVDNARSAVITISSATTDEVVTLGGLTYTYTTSTALFTVSSGSGTTRYFGSTLGASVAEGLASAMHSLATGINNSSHGVPGITATTNTTAAVLLTLDDTAATAGVAVINLTATGAGLTVSYDSAEAIIEVQAADLTSGQKYVSLTASTSTASMVIAITSIRDGRHIPAIVQGQLTKTTAASS